MNTIILASSSPRRRDLLEQAGIGFIVKIPRIDEHPIIGESPVSYVLRMAQEKASSVQPDGDSPILGADTIVVLDGTIMGKPLNRAEAVSMIKALSGRWHRVMTGVCILRTGQDPTTFVESTEVLFRGLDEQTIQDYVDSGEPMDKAGAYAIQGGGGAFVEKVKGLYSNVVGLPVERVLRTCSRLNDEGEVEI